jgi:hypothetical protein
MNEMHNSMPRKTWLGSSRFGEGSTTWCVVLRLRKMGVMEYRTVQNKHFIVFIIILRHERYRRLSEIDCCMT